MLPRVLLLQLSLLSTLLPFSWSVLPPHQGSAPGVPVVPSITLFDARPLMGGGAAERAGFYESMHLLTAIQGVVNR